jgi:hypothetical protein
MWCKTTYRAARSQSSTKLFIHFMEHLYAPPVKEAMLVLQPFS